MGSDAILPRGCYVRITGNNRTKWDLLGKEGYVRAAQTLGGWHEVQLESGAVVRVQRNALALVEPYGGVGEGLRVLGASGAMPNTGSNSHSQSTVTNVIGNGNDNSSEENAPLHSEYSSPYAVKGVARNYPSGVGVRVHAPSVKERPLGGGKALMMDAEFGKRCNRDGQAEMFGGQPRVTKTLAENVNSGNGHPSGVRITIPGRFMNPGVDVKRKKKARVGSASDGTHANIAKLNVSSLRKYRRHYKLNIAKDCSKDELVGAVRKHFAKTKVNESEVISNFLRYIARGASAAND